MTSESKALKSIFFGQVWTIYFTALRDENLGLNNYNSNKRRLGNTVFTRSVAPLYLTAGKPISTTILFNQMDPLLKCCYYSSVVTIQMWH